MVACTRAGGASSSWYLGGGGGLALPDPAGRRAAPLVVAGSVGPPRLGFVGLPGGVAVPGVVAVPAVADALGLVGVLEVVGVPEVAGVVEPGGGVLEPAGVPVSLGVPGLVGVLVSVGVLGLVGVPVSVGGSALVGVLEALAGLGSAGGAGSLEVLAWLGSLEAELVLVFLVGVLAWLGSLEAELVLVLLGVLAWLGSLEAELVLLDETVALAVLGAVGVLEAEGSASAPVAAATGPGVVASSIALSVAASAVPRRPRCRIRTPLRLLRWPSRHTTSVTDIAALQKNQSHSLRERITSAEEIAASLGRHRTARNTSALDGVLAVTSRGSFSPFSFFSPFCRAPGA